MSLSTASQNTLSQRPTWIDLSARRAIANQLVEFVLGQLPSFSKLGKKEIAQLNSLMPVELAANVTLTGLSRSTRGLTWGKPVKCLLVHFTYFTGMKGDRTVELKEEAPLVVEPVATKIPSKFDDNKLSEREIREITNDVQRRGKIDSWSISMVYGSTNGLFDSGELVEVGGFITLAEVEVPRAAAPVAQDELDRQISEHANSNDPAYRAHSEMLRACTTSNAWFDDLVAEDEARLAEEKAALVEYHKQLGLAGAVLTIEGLSCKNLDRPNDPYWCFLGSEQACLDAQLVLMHEHLIRDAFVTPHSKNGEKWKLTVKPRILTGYIETSHLREAMERVA